MTASDDQAELEAWDDVLDDSNYYEILGLLELADADAIRTAFHEFAAAFHPDAHRSAAPEVRAMAQRVFKRGAEAYRVLSDPELRSKYDLAVARGHLRLGGTDGARPPREGLKSLEDLCLTPAARLSAHRAEERIGQGKLAEARAMLREAIALDGENDALQERLEALDLALFAMGD